MCTCVCVCECTCACMHVCAQSSLTLRELGESAAGASHQACVTTLSETWGNWTEFREEQLVQLKGLEGLRD